MHESARSPPELLTGAGEPGAGHYSTAPPEPSRDPQAPRRDSTVFEVGVEGTCAQKACRRQLQLQANGTMPLHHPPSSSNGPHPICRGSQRAPAAVDADTKGA